MHHELWYDLLCLRYISMKDTKQSTQNLTIEFNPLKTKPTYMRAGVYGKYMLKRTPESLRLLQRPFFIAQYILIQQKKK